MRNVSADGVRVFNLHGGYFSGVLSNWGLKGFSHGPGYGGKLLKLSVQLASTGIH